MRLSPSSKIRPHVQEKGRGNELPQPRHFIVPFYWNQQGRGINLDITNRHVSEFEAIPAEFVFTFVSAGFVHVCDAGTHALDY